jgi:glycosyltransferase involved in cell wall biosynthesis
VNGRDEIATKRDCKIAVVCDYPEEGWPSMDLAAEMLLAHAPPARQTAQRVCPPFRRRLGRLPWLGRRRAAFNADRLLNRFVYYPRHVRRGRADFDAFHVADHSYAQLVHELPGGRTGVFCHDLDTFRCLLEPGAEPRPWWFRSLARSVLAGMQKAAVVFHSTADVRRQIERHGLIDPARLVQAPYGVAAEFTADPAGEEALPPAVIALQGRPYLLHVGSCIPRKRIDVLLDAFACLRACRPDLRLVKVGGPWADSQRQQVARHGIADSVVQLVGLGRQAVAALYRRAALVLVPSEAEGFGLPVIEALACGAVVLASDLPVLREVGGDAVVYRPVGDVPAWAEAAGRLLDEPDAAPARAARVAHAARYTWAAHAGTIFAAYRRLLGEP